MTTEQKIAVRLSEVRSRLNEISGLEGDAFTPEIRTEAGTLQGEYGDLEVRHRAAIVATPPETVTETVDAPDAEMRERLELRGRSRVHRFMSAAFDMKAVDGAEAEFSAASGNAGGFPLELLAPEAPEIRATTNAETVSRPGKWLDRLFAVAAAKRLGVTMRSVPAGVASLPVTTAGASGAQQDRGESTTDAAFTVGVTEMKPKRGSVRAIFSIEDQARLPGLEDALKRDLRMALVDSVDKAIFRGDAGPSTAAYDLVGLQTAGVGEITLTQANKVKGKETLAKFLGLVDGLHAESLGDLNIITSVGTNVLWGSTIVAAAVENQTLAQFLRANGMSWGTRAAIDTNTVNGGFGAYIGLSRGIDGAAVAAMWESGSMIRDPYSDAAKGEVALTLNYLWDFAVPRTASFKRLKFVS